MEPFWQNGWVWIIAAALIALIELVVPGYVFLSLGVAAAVIGLALLAGVWGAGLAVTLLVAAIIAAGVMLSLRRIFGTSRGEKRVWRRDINDN